MFPLILIYLTDCCFFFKYIMEKTPLLDFRVLIGKLDEFCWYKECCKSTSKALWVSLGRSPVECSCRS